MSNPNPTTSQSQNQPQRQQNPRPAVSGDEVIIYADRPGRHQQYRVLELRPQGPLVTCPYCGYSVTPVITHEPSLFAWIMCMAVSIIFMPFFFIGFLIGYFILVADSMQEAKYVCPLCGSFLPVTTAVLI